MKCKINSGRKFSFVEKEENLRKEWIGKLNFWKINSKLSFLDKKEENSNVELENLKKEVSYLKQYNESLEEKFEEMIKSVSMIKEGWEKIDQLCNHFQQEKKIKTNFLNSFLVSSQPSSLPPEEKKVEERTFLVEKTSKINESSPTFLSKFQRKRSELVISEPKKSEKRTSPVNLFFFLFDFHKKLYFINFIFIFIL